MPRLGDKLEKMSHLRRGLGASPGAHVNERQMKEVQGFGVDPGALRMLTYIPKGLPPNAPLVVVLHGCTQRASAHAANSGWLSLADQLQFAVLAPEQLSANNPNRCFNWFEPGDTVRGAGEAASIRAMIEHCVNENALDPRRVFVTGLSAGGAMAAVMMATYPEVFAAGAIIAGLPYGLARNVSQAISLMHSPKDISGAQLGALIRAATPGATPYPRVAIWHGDADRTVDPRNGALLAGQWASAHDLPAHPDSVETLDRRVRSIWCSNSGAVIIELNVVQGLGHGTPLAAAGENGLGAVGPYMLEAGISSSLEVARFWGLAPAPAALTTLDKVSRTASDTKPSRQTPFGVGQTVISAVSAHVSQDVRSTIERALKSAGLM